MSILDEKNKKTLRYDICLRGLDARTFHVAQYEARHNLCDLIFCKKIGSAKVITLKAYSFDDVLRTIETLETDPTVTILDISIENKAWEGRRKRMVSLYSGRVKQGPSVAALTLPMAKHA